MNRKILTLILIHTIALQASAQTNFNITNFGAIADGKTISTKAIQKAIDSCSTSGGGTVYFPAGIFITGALKLRSNINLYLSAGSVLKGSSAMADYTLDGVTAGILFGEDLINISITGEGEINGNAVSFFDPSKMHNYIDFDKKYVRQGQAFFNALKADDGPIAYKERPNMTVILLHCENVKISGVHFVDAPSWTVRIGDCENVAIDGTSILNNHLVPNSDGLHITLSRNVRISNCNINTGDDAIIVTGFGADINMGNTSDGNTKRNYKYGNKSGNAENILVSNCILKSNSAGIRIGYGMGNMKDMIFSNIIIYNSNRGVLMNARETGSIENVLFENFIIKTKHQGGNWWGRGEPIHISSFPISSNVVNGSIKNVSFKNFKIESETGVVVWANKVGRVSNISFDNVDILIKNGKNVASFGGNIDLRPTPDMSTNIFKRDLPAILFQNIEQVKINTMSTKFIEAVPEFYTHGLEIVDGSNFQVTNSDFTSSSPKFVPVMVTKSKNIVFDNNASFKLNNTDK